MPLAGGTTRPTKTVAPPATSTTSNTGPPQEKAFSAATPIPTYAASPPTTDTPVVPATSPAVPQKPPAFSLESLGHGSSRRSRQGGEEDAGLVAGVVEETRTTVVEEVEEIPRLSQLEEDEVPL